MNKKKHIRFLSLLLSIVLITVSLAACTNKKEPEANDNENVISDNNVEEKPKEPEIDLDRDAVGENGVVASAKPEASEVGVEIMKKGGNAIDAAVATAFALGVVEPNASGIGGGGFMMIRDAETGEDVFLDFREIAPINATEDMYELDENGKVVNEEQTVGGKAAAVPGDVAGLLLALEKYGTMTREEVLEPAIKLAEEGYEVTSNFAGIITDNFEKINKYDATAKIYLDDGLPYESGSILKNPDLANTLKLIAEHGEEVFYKGEIADDIVKASEETGGIITKEDLESYNVRVLEPIKGTYRGYEIISAPPSSSGGTHVIQLLNILENYDIKGLGLNTKESLHLWSEAAKLVFADRAEFMADTEFVDVPLAGLANKEYAKELSETIELDKAHHDLEHGNPKKYESGSTTHLSVMDKSGNMVAVTKTINYFFGSGVTVPGRGFILNNEMDDFNAEPGTSNSIQPRKKPLSSMTPTFVLKEGKPYITLGSPGATRIIPTVAQIISNIVDHDMNVQEAINAPRMFDGFGTLALESRIDDEVVKALEELGHNVDVKGAYDPYFGGAQCIMLEDSGTLHGGGDPRRDGMAVGY